MNLRTPVLGGVTASDASETGGGFCVSRGLTPMGVHAAQLQCARGHARVGGLCSGTDGGVV